MKYNLILWLFFFVYCAICFNTGRSLLQVQTNGLKISTSSPVNSNVKQIESGILAKLPEGSFVTPLNSKRSIRFVGYNEGANSSLLVVERWESSFKDDDNSSDNSVLTYTDSDNKGVTTGDYSVMLLHGGATEKKKIDDPANKVSIDASKKEIPGNNKKSTPALFE